MTDYEDFPEEAKKVKCQECGRKMWRLTNTHLWHVHRMTNEEYKEKYPESIIEDPVISQWRQRSTIGKTYEEIYGKEKAILLKADRSERTKLQMQEDVQVALRKEKCGYEHTEEQKKAVSIRNTIEGSDNYRERALEYYGQECMRCGAIEDDLVVHHLDFQNIRSPLGNHSIENLMVLCKPCHARMHRDFKKGKFVGINNIEKGVHYILKGLSDEFGLDLHDENLKDTPKRVARAYYEMCSGINCDEDIDNILSTSFPANYDGIVVAKNIQCFSMCPHHLLPVTYSVNVGYIPKDRAIGISKIPRIVELLAKAPKLQEDFTRDIVEALKRIDCKGVIVQVTGKHMCMGARGIKQPNVSTITSSIYGVFEQAETRAEFQMMINNEV